MKISLMKSKAFNLAVLFSILIAFIIVVFLSVFAFVLHMNNRKRQYSMISHTVELIKTKVLENEKRKISEADFYEIPYFLSFSIYMDSNNEVIYTNDPFIGILPKTNGKPNIYFEKNYFIDGDLNILYTTGSFEMRNHEYTVQVSMSLDRDFASTLLSELLFSILIFSIPLLVISFLASFFIIKSTISPVRKMTRTAMNLSYNSECKFEVKGSGDEFDNLAETFNTLFERLKRELKREKLFTSDVSHELKTPIAVIVGHANLIRRWGKNDPVQLEKSIDRLVGEAKNMQSIIENLLKLSRLERGTVEIEKKSVPILPIIQRLKENTETWAENVHFNAGKIENIEIYCNEELLYEALTNIVSNSIKYTSPEDVVINMEIEETEKQYLVKIEDNGPGIKKEQLPHVTERFYRGDESHNRSKSGNGLGLAIAKSIMDIHNGWVQIDSDGIKGTTVTLAFPKINPDN